MAPFASSVRVRLSSQRPRPERRSAARGAREPVRTPRRPPRPPVGAAAGGPDRQHASQARLCTTPKVTLAVHDHGWIARRPGSAWAAAGIAPAGRVAGTGEVGIVPPPAEHALLLGAQVLAIGAPAGQPAPSLLVESAAQPGPRRPAPACATYACTTRAAVQQAIAVLAKAIVFRIHVDARQVGRARRHGARRAAAWVTNRAEPVVDVEQDPLIFGGLRLVATCDREQHCSSQDPPRPSLPTIHANTLVGNSAVWQGKYRSRWRLGGNCPAILGAPLLDAQGGCEAAVRTGRARTADLAPCLVGRGLRPATVSAGGRPRARRNMGQTG